MNPVALGQAVWNVFLMVLVAMAWPSLFLVRLWVSRGWDKKRLVGLVMLGWLILFWMVSVAPGLDARAKTSSMWVGLAGYAGARAINAWNAQAGWASFAFHYGLFQTMLPLPLLLAYAALSGGTLKERVQRRSFGEWFSGCGKSFRKKKSRGLSRLASI
jgi:hypothetical protein